MAGMGTAALSALFDGTSIVVLIPFLKHLFGTAGPLSAGGTALESVVDRALGPFLVGTTPLGAALRMVVFLGGALLLKNLFGYASTQVRVRIQEGVVKDLRTRVFNHLLLVDLGFFQSSRVGHILSTLIADTDQVKVAVTAAFASFITNTAVLFVTLGILTSISWRLTLLTLATVPVLLFGVQMVLKRLRRHAAERVEERGELTGLANEQLSAMRLLRASGTEEQEARRFDEQAERYRKRVIRTERFSQLTQPVTEVFAGFVLILVIWAATVPSITGTPLGPEVTIVFLLAALKITSPLKALTQFPAQWSGAAASAERVFQLTDLSVVEHPNPGEREALFNEQIEFAHVSFRYPSGVQVLDDVSFVIEKGQVVALVGPSGAGKTTIAELLPRFFEPTSGEIRMDGIPLPDLSRRSLRSLLAVVGQDTVLLNDTVQANIAYGCEGATRAQVAAAARAANATEFIEKLPEGFETRIGERGTRLSGGQRQRLAIARALLRDAPLLILDEATSALDTESERLVQQAIDRLMCDRTVLVIAHRLPTIRHADLILVLDEGRIVERGSHLELHDWDGLYRRLHDLQFLSPEEAFTR